MLGLTAIWIECYYLKGEEVGEIGGSRRKSEEVVEVVEVGKVSHFLTFSQAEEVREYWSAGDIFPARRIGKAEKSVKLGNSGKNYWRIPQLVVYI